MSVEFRNPESTKAPKIDYAGPSLLHESAIVDAKELARSFGAHAAADIVREMNDIHKKSDNNPQYAALVDKSLQAELKAAGLPELKLTYSPAVSDSSGEARGSVVNLGSATSDSHRPGEHLSANSDWKIGSQTNPGHAEFYDVPRSQHDEAIR